mgnify:CR=1 FL=1
MIKKSEFIIGMVIMFFLFLFVNGLIVSDINETMRTLKRPVVLHDTTSVMRYIDRYIHDTTVITQTKTEYIEKVSLIGRMQDYADPEEKETTFKLFTYPDSKKVTVTVTGVEEELATEDLLIESAQKEGYVSDSNYGITVVLDTNLTQALIEEGFVRELISKVQTMRKTIR